MLRKIDKEHKFISMFDPKTGMYVRSGVIADGKDTGVDPFMTTFPELIDIGVMGNCEHGKSGLCVKSGVKCYQSGLVKHQPNMSPETFKGIIDQCTGKTFQVALGGRGDVNKHETFEGLLMYCRSKNIVPNYTTSGLNLTDAEVAITKEYCGAVAVSWYRHEHTLRALDMFIKAGCKTNIHYVLGKFSIDEAITRLKNNDFPAGVNAVIFLMHKPVGLATEADMLDSADPRVAEFFGLIDTHKFPFKVGFDSCSVPGIINYSKNISKDSIDTCEGARWSMYITPDAIALPCSFDQDHTWGVDLKTHTIKQAWDSPAFDEFRNSFLYACPSCSSKRDCMGGCPIKKQIVLCAKPERSDVQKLSV